MLDLRERYRLLSELIVMLGEIERQISFSSRPISELFLRLGEQNRFTSRLSRELLKGKAYEQAVEGASTELVAETALTASDAEMLCETVKLIGSSDTGGELTRLQALREQLEEKRADAKKASDEKGRMCLSVSALCGAAVSLLII